MSLGVAPKALSDDLETTPGINSANILDDAVVKPSSVEDPGRPVLFLYGILSWLPCFSVWAFLFDLQNEHLNFILGSILRW